MPRVPRVVRYALAQHRIEPINLRSFEVTDCDVFLYLKSGFSLRVEKSSLPERALVDEAAVVETTVSDEPVPERAEKVSRKAGPKRPARGG